MLRLETVASLYPSGSRPDRCPDGHELGPNRMLVGNLPCIDCPEAAAHFHRHVYIRCRGGEDRCAWEFVDPPHNGEAWIRVR